MGFDIEHAGIHPFLLQSGAKSALSAQPVITGVVLLIPFLMIILLIFSSLSKRSVTFVRLFRRAKPLKCFYKIQNGHGYFKLDRLLYFIRAVLDAPFRRLPYFAVGWGKCCTSHATAGAESGNEHYFVCDKIKIVGACGSDSRNRRRIRKHITVGNALPT